MTFEGRGLLAMIKPNPDGVFERNLSCRLVY
jgi:hypothetical protein